MAFRMAIVNVGFPYSSQVTTKSFIKSYLKRTSIYAAEAATGSLSVKFGRSLHSRTRKMVCQVDIV